MLPPEIVRHVRSFCDTETKIAMYRAGIPMEPVSTTVGFAPHKVGTNCVGEPYMELKMGTATYTVIKGNITPFLVYLDGSEHRHWCGFPRGSSYMFVEVYG